MNQNVSVASLPLYQRTISRTVTFFYCSKCGREKPFSWHYAHCTESGDLVCCAATGWKLCRRCQQPRQRRGAENQFTISETVCDGCPGPHADMGDPLQLVCSHCATSFTARRSDAKFCSGKCRTAAHRARRWGLPPTSHHPKNNA